MVSFTVVSFIYFVHKLTLYYFKVGNGLQLRPGSHTVYKRLYFNKAGVCKDSVRIKLGISLTPNVSLTLNRSTVSRFFGLYLSCKRNRLDFWYKDWCFNTTGRCDVIDVDSIDVPLPEIVTHEYLRTK